MKDHLNLAVAIASVLGISISSIIGFLITIPHVINFSTVVDLLVALILLLFCVFLCGIEWEKVEDNYHLRWYRRYIPFFIKISTMIIMIIIIVALLHNNVISKMGWIQV